MMRLVLALLLTCCFTFATQLAPTVQAWHKRDGGSTSPMLALAGDSRRMFANQFYVMADVYFHSGYYPTIFDGQKKEGPSHLDVASQDSGSQKSNEPDDDDNFLGKPKDWIDAFGRNFYPTKHTHLDSPAAREILPWLRLSADLDPQRIDTYITAAYWLRTQLHQTAQAEQFLREGLRANPDSSEILLALGQVYFYDKNQSQSAHNIWDLALKKWQVQETNGEKPDPRLKETILGEMVRADEKSKNLPQLLADLQELATISQGKKTVQNYIDEVKKRMVQP